MKEVVRFVVVPNPQGIHARPSFQIIQTANRYKSNMSLENTRDGNVVNAKSMVDLLTLNAPKGTKLRIVAHGDDADAAAVDLENVIAAGFGEMPDGGAEVQ